MQAIAGAKHDTSSKTSTPNWRRYVTLRNYTLLKLTIQTGTPQQQQQRVDPQVG